MNIILNKFKNGVLRLCVGMILQKQPLKKNDTKRTKKAEDFLYTLGLYTNREILCWPWGYLYLILGI